FGNNVVNILATAITTVIMVRLYGELGVALTTIILTPVILIFAETAPKTWAAVRPEKVAFPAAYVLTPLLKICYPVIYIINKISNAIIALSGINVHEKDD